MCRNDKLITQGTKAGLKRTTICTHVDIFVSVHLSEGGVTSFSKLDRFSYYFMSHSKFVLLSLLLQLCYLGCNFFASV